MLEHAGTHVKLRVEVGVLSQAELVADDRRGDNLRARRRNVAGLGIDGGQASVASVASGETLQRDLRADIGVARGEKVPLARDRHLDRDLGYEVPALGLLIKPVAQPEYWVQQAAFRQVGLDHLSALEVVANVDF